MKRIAALFLTLAVSTVSLSAMAHDGKFPMKADVFQKHIDERVAHAKARLEQELQKNKATDAQAKEARAKFDAVVAKVGETTKKATADGVVTKDEAKTVRQVARELGSGGHRHEHHKSK